MVFGTCIMGWVGFLFASNKRTESVYQFSSNRTEWLWSVLSVGDFFFFKMQFMPSRQQRAVKKESNIYSSGNKHYHYIFLTLHRCEDISNS